MTFLQGREKKADSVEVVRCKDCLLRAYIDQDGDVSVPLHTKICPYCIGHLADQSIPAIIPQDDHFCSTGVRKDDAE